MSFAYEGYINDILQPLGSRCKLRNECATNPKNATDKHARIKETSEHPRGRILTRPSRRFGLFEDLGESDEISSIFADSTSEEADCLVGVDVWCGIRRAVSAFVDCNRRGEVGEYTELGIY